MVINGRPLKHQTMNSVAQHKIGVAEIFHLFKDDFLKLYPQPAEHHQVMHLIQACRTAKLGGHLQTCDHCNFSKPMYNSCRCRMCPQCQSLKKERWVSARKNELLPCSYLHGVFTLPHEINILASRNKDIIYKTLFTAVAQTLQKFALDSLKGQLGFISVLHTWDQKLNRHIHLHCIIPAGAFGRAQSKWIPSKRDDFLFPVRALSKVYKAKFIQMLRQNFEKLELPNHLQKPEDFNNFLDSLWNKKWVVYAKQPFKGPEKVIEYLGRYTHKTAISNSRILKIQGNTVTIKYRDRRDNNTEKNMEINGSDFLRRFMLHTLPKGFHRIRHYGFLAHRFKNQNIEAIYKALQKCRPQSSQQLNAVSFFKTKFNIDITRCPQCKKGTLCANSRPPP